jgi:hypothetical protein
MKIGAKEVFAMKAKHKLRIALPLITLLLLSLVLSACATEEPQPAQQDPIALEPSVEERLDPVHPDEPVSHTYNTRFSLENALTRLSLLKEQGGELSEEAAMAFNNSVGALEGTLRKQEYELKRLEFELAKHQYRDGHITKEQLDEKGSAYLRGTEDFKSFWTNFGISD